MKPLITRSILRDIVLCACCASALFWYAGTGRVVTGFALLVIGSLLHVLSKGILVRNTVLCDKGIYGFVRHPYYLANYLIDSGFCVLSGNAYLLLIYPFLFFWAYGPTLRKEEALLGSLHEAAFASHSARVPQVFPDRASLRDWRTVLDGFSRRRITWKESGRIARFWSLGFLILLIHELRADGFVGLLDLVRPTRMNYDETLSAALVVLLYGVSWLLISRSRKARHRLEVREQDTSE
jgi:hypothetical protein